MKRRVQPVTPTRIRIAAAAKMMGVSRAQAYRRLRQYAVFSDGPGSRLEIDSARVYKLIANERLGEQPMMPELRRINEKLDESDDNFEGLAKHLGETLRVVRRIAQKLGA